MVRNPFALSQRMRLKRRPYEKNLAWAYEYEIVGRAPTKEELRLRYIKKIIKNPFQKTGWLGLRKRKK